MSKDIIKNFLNKNNSNINYRNIININNKFNNNEKYSERTIIKMKKLNMKITKNIKKNNHNQININEEISNKKINILFKKINYCHILRSLLCFKDKYSRFINKK